MATATWISSLQEANEDPWVEGAKFLGRHQAGDWGDLGEEDTQANQRALEVGERLLSVYRTPSGIKTYVITEWDRSVTTILLPEDY